MFKLREHHMSALARSYSALQLSTTLKQLGLTTEYKEGQGELLARDPLGNASRVDLDRHGRIERTTSPTGQVHEFGYTATHRLASFRSSNRTTAAWVYDEHDRLLALRSGCNAPWGFRWDSFNNLAAVTSPDGSTAEIAWFAPGLLAAMRDADGGVVVFNRDDAGRITAIKHPNGQVTRLEYSSFDRPDRITRPDGSVEEFRRTSQGRISSAALNGQLVAEIAWTPAGKLQEVACPDGHLARFKYDGAGRATEGVSPGAFVSRAYNDAGHLLEEKLGDSVVRMAYNSAGLMNSITWPTGENVEFGYDADGRVTSVRDWSGKSHGIKYAANGTATHHLASGIIRSELCDEDGRCGGFDLISPAASEILGSLRLQHNAMGKVAIISDSQHGLRTFRYDSNGRLAGVSQNGYSTEEYAYDFNGNRSSTSCGPMDEVLSADGTRMTYDMRGNLATRENRDGFSRYHFNDAGALIRVNLPDSRHVEYAYDAFGRRISKRLGGSLTRYTWAGDQLLREETTGPGVHSLCDYLYLPGTNAPYAMRLDGRVYHFHNDHLGSPRWLTDEAGCIAWSGCFKAFGSPLHIEGGVQQPWRFPGQYYDEETGLHYNRARYYSPSLGRYISRDPLEFAAGLNHYVYADNDPVNNNDPSGLDGLSGWGKALLATAIVAVGAVVVIAALPVIATAVATTTITSAVLFAAADVVAGTTIVGLGVGLGVAPDGCAECQAKSMLKYGVEGFGAGVAAVGMMLGIPAMAGAGGLALVGGGVLASEAAVGTSVAAVASGYAMMSQASKMDGGGNDAPEEPNEEPAKQKSPGNMQKQVEKGQAPKSVDRIDKGRGPFEKDHIEFKSGDALNKDGTWKHGGRPLTGEESNWVTKNGWTLPK